jgi:hypothetical protein
MLRSSPFKRPCPVCGGRVLDDVWASSTAASITELASQAAAADAAHDAEAAAVRALSQLVPSKLVI